MARKSINKNHPYCGSGILPRLLRPDAAARYLSSTAWFIENKMRNGEIPFRWVGKRKVIDVSDLDHWIELQPYAVVDADALTLDPF
jgi:hypothetical protein